MNSMMSARSCSAEDAQMTFMDVCLQPLLAGLHDAQQNAIQHLQSSEDVESRFAERRANLQAKVASTHP